MASNLRAMASNLIAMASNQWSEQLHQLGFRLDELAALPFCRPREVGTVLGHREDH